MYTSCHGATIVMTNCTIASQKCSFAFYYHSVIFLIIQLFSMAEPFIQLLQIIYTQDIFIAYTYEQRLS